MKKQTKLNQVLFGLLLFFVLASFLLVGLAPDSVLAQGSNELLWGGQAGNVQAETGLGDTDPRIVIANIIRVVLGFLGIIAVILIIYAGWLWTASGGDEQAISRAKRILTNAVIGLIIILMAFGIATFIINALLDGTRGGPGGEPGGSPGSGFSGFAAAGNCTVERVYPAPGQRDVPRNTSIIITFKEPVDPTTVCNDANGDGECSGGETIRDDRIFIYPREQGSDSAISDVLVAHSADNLTFVFTPSNYLGSPSEYIWYAVNLTNDILKPDGTGIFSTCASNEFGWQFEVSNRLDLTPPQVQGGGVYPPPDDTQDIVSGTAGELAAGQVEVVGQPDTFEPAEVISVTESGGWSSAQVVDLDANCEEDQALTVTTDSANLDQAQLSRAATLLGTGTINGNRVDFTYCGLSLELDNGTFASECDGSQGECGWEVQISPVQHADTLTVGSLNYTFVSDEPGGYEIELGLDNAVTANSIASVVDSHPSVAAEASNNIVTLTAEVPGDAGNDIVLDTTANELNITGMSGGVAEEEIVSVNDRPDKVRNTVIQLNFNEAIYPANISGEAQDLADAIRVVCLSGDCGGDVFDCGGENCLDGQFIVSNQYKTIEFLSHNVCGVNGCGEEIYCLPPNTELRVEVEAASLEGCVNCEAKSPFNDCTGGHCYNSEAGVYHPLSAAPPDGIADVALNSLDGDRSGDAEGPGVFYDENTESGEGDDYAWSFWISDRLDLDPPAITATYPEHNNENGADLRDPVRISFNDLMMSSSLRTGRAVIDSENGRITHYYINLSSPTGQRMGYWVSKQDNDTVEPLDGYADQTDALLNHTPFMESASFRAQAGSGLKDINQNCFNPSDGPACVGESAAQPTCCSGTVTSDPTCEE
jgi:HSP20 family molecular chaperone IbpA